MFRIKKIKVIEKAGMKNKVRAEQPQQQQFLS